MKELSTIVLDKRLALLAEEMTPGGFGVDVGTDHGYLAVHLAGSGRAARMLATDVNEQPLQSARRCIEEHGVGDRVDTRLTDGLKGLELTGITDIFIAGMGGILISEILAARHPLHQKLILQPMTQAPALRRWLCENGYEILRERCAVTGGKAYTVLTARYTGRVQPCSPLFALVGRAPEDSSPDGMAYLRRQLTRLERKAEGLRRSAGAFGEELAETEALADALRAILGEKEGTE